jgi:transposase
MSLLGVSAEHAGQLLATAGGNPQRLRSEAAFAALCAAAFDPCQQWENRPTSA